LNVQMGFMLLLQDKRQKNIRIINKMKAKIIEIANEAIELMDIFMVKLSMTNKIII